MKRACGRLWALAKAFFLLGARIVKSEIKKYKKKKIPPAASEELFQVSRSFLPACLSGTDDSEGSGGLGGRTRGERGRRDAARPCFTPSFRRRERPCADGCVPARRLLGIGALLPQRSALLSYDWLVTLTSAHHQSLPPPPGAPPLPPPPPPGTHSTSSTLPLISLSRAAAMMDTAGGWCGGGGGGGLSFISPGGAGKWGGTTSASSDKKIS